MPKDPSNILRKLKKMHPKSVAKAEKEIKAVSKAIEAVFGEGAKAERIGTALRPLTLKAKGKITDKLAGTAVKRMTTRVTKSLGEKALVRTGIAALGKVGPVLGKKVFPAIQIMGDLNELRTTGPQAVKAIAGARKAYYENLDLEKKLKGKKYTPKAKPSWAK